MNRWWQDTSSISQLASHFVINSVQRQWEKLSQAWQPALRDQNPARLDRPVLLVPGWSTETEIFAPLISKLEERNQDAVYVRAGQFFSDSECLTPTVPSEKTRVFMMVYKDNRSEPGDFVAEFGKAMQSLPGKDKVDILGYSVGGIAARGYLDTGGQRVGKLLMLGTPNKGAALVGASAHILRRDIQWAYQLAGLQLSDLPALEDIAPESDYLQDLNARWDQQMAQAEAVELAGAVNMPTLSERGLPWFHGDGLVSGDSLALPGISIKRLDGEPAALHEHQPYSVGAYRAMVEFFGWNPG